MKRGIVRVLALFGALMLAVLGFGLVADIRGFDETRGGYEPPYSDYTGEPIDWSRLDWSPDGFVKRGRVIDVLVACETGMISLSAFGVTREWRRVSPRALAVHRPREACRAQGHVTRF